MKKTSKVEINKQGRNSLTQLDWWGKIFMKKWGFSWDLKVKM